MNELVTRDNIHLSEVIQVSLRASSGVNCTRTSVLGCTDPTVLEFIAAATTLNTRRAYRSDIAQFQARGGSIPATAEQVARYLADHAAMLSMATLARRLVAIRLAHAARGLPDPTQSELVRLTFRGIRRKHGQPQRRVAALGTGDLLAIVRSLNESARDIRDAAILLVGYAGALRRSELAAINCNDIDTREDGILIRIPRSKTDQERHGRAVSIPRVRNALCPVAALDRWLCISRTTERAVFRRVTKGGKVLQSRISPEAIARIVKDRVEVIGGDPSCYSGHSLRAGFATGAARLGVPMWRIRAQTGHLSDSALERYIREGEFTLHVTETQQVSPS
jgi:integrase